MTCLSKKNFIGISTPLAWVKIGWLKWEVTKPNDEHSLKREFSSFLKRTEGGEMKKWKKS